jgi:hypothetical protein
MKTLLLTTVAVAISLTSPAHARKWWTIDYGPARDIPDTQETSPPTQATQSRDFPNVTSKKSCRSDSITPASFFEMERDEGRHPAIDDSGYKVTITSDSGHQNWYRNLNDCRREISILNLDKYR